MSGHAGITSLKQLNLSLSLRFYYCHASCKSLMFTPFLILFLKIFFNKAVIFFQDRVCNYDQVSGLIKKLMQSKSKFSSCSSPGDVVTTCLKSCLFELQHYSIKLNANWICYQSFPHFPQLIATDINAINFAICKRTIVLHSSTANLIIA